MPLQDFLRSVKPNQTIYLILPGSLVRGAFVKINDAGDLVSLTQVAVFQNSQATASIPNLTISLRTVIAWG